MKYIAIGIGFIVILCGVIFSIHEIPKEPQAPFMICKDGILWQRDYFDKTVYVKTDSVCFESTGKYDEIY